MIESFSEKLKELRGNRTLQEVSDAIGISRVTMGVYERGERLPGAEVLYEICKYYAVSSDYLLGIDNKAEEAYKIVKDERDKLRQKLYAAKVILESE